jgi:hypothetical protein
MDERDMEKEGVGKPNRQIKHLIKIPNIQVSQNGVLTVHYGVE